MGPVGFEPATYGLINNLIRAPDRCIHFRQTAGLVGLENVLSGPTFQAKYRWQSITYPNDLTKPHRLQSDAVLRNLEATLSSSSTSVQQRRWKAGWGFGFDPSLFCDAAVALADVEGLGIRGRSTVLTLDFVPASLSVSRRQFCFGHRHLALNKKRPQFNKQLLWRTN